MTEEGLDEIVLLFESDLSAINTELHYKEFEALLNGSATLAQYAASQVRGVYVAVGNKLSVRAMVFFYMKVDEHGRVDEQFNVPLRYLARQAGLGPDLGSGQQVRIASRRSCPVPWHAKHLWEPQGVGDLHPAKRVQKIVWRNRLELTPRKVVASMDLNTKSMQALHATLEKRLQDTLTQQGSVDVPSLIAQHNQQLQQLAQRFELELAHQQQGHEDALRGKQEELQKLRTALRHEKSRNRRLQEMLRGDAESEK